MFGPAELLFPLLWNLLPQRTRESLSKSILALQSRTGISVPPSEVRLYDGAKPPDKAALPAYSLLSTCFNERAGIERWLDSVASQTHAPRELIVVDGGSRDGTVRSIEKWKASRQGKIGFEVKVIAEGRKNIAEGRNRAAAEAREEIIAFTDAGCELDRFWAERLLEPFAAAPETEVSMGWFKPIHESRLAHALARFLLPQIQALDPQTFLPSGRSLALKKTVFLRGAGYPEFLSFAGEDSLFDYYLKCDAEKFAFVPNALAFWRMPVTPFKLSRTVFNYARGDAEGGKLFWLYYVNLLREAGHIALELVLLFALVLLNSLLKFKLLTWAALILGAFISGRYFALVMKYRPLEGKGIFNADGFHSFLAVQLLVLSQTGGFLRGLLARRQVERRRRRRAPAGIAVLVTPSAPLRGEKGPEIDEIRALLAEGFFVTHVFQAYPKQPGGVLFEHQLLDSYLRSNFQLESWWEKERNFSFKNRIVIDTVNDALSRTLADQLQAAGFERRDERKAGRR